jgi:hypothetical protein
LGYILITKKGDILGISIIFERNFAKNILLPMSKCPKGSQAKKRLNLNALLTKTKWRPETIQTGRIPKRIIK